MEDIKRAPPPLRPNELKGSRFFFRTRLRLLMCLKFRRIHRCWMGFSERYESGFQYLDTHFRLLREDFVKPLRESVQAILNRRSDLGNEEVHCEAVWYYPNVVNGGKVASTTSEVRNQ